MIEKLTASAQEAIDPCRGHCWFDCHRYRQIHEAGRFGSIEEVSIQQDAGRSPRYQTVQEFRCGELTEDAMPRFEAGGIGHQVDRCICLEERVEHRRGGGDRRATSTPVEGQRRSA